MYKIKKKTINKKIIKNIKINFKFKNIFNLYPKREIYENIPTKKRPIKPIPLSSKIVKVDLKELFVNL